MIGVLELLNKRKVKENKKIIKNIWEKWLLFQSLNYWCHATLKAYYIQRLEILEGNSSCVHVCVYIYFAFRASKHEWWEIWRWVLWLWSMWDRDSFFFLHFLMPCDLLSLTLSLLSFFKSYTNFFMWHLPNNVRYELIHSPHFIIITLYVWVVTIIFIIIEVDNRS